MSWKPPTMASAIPTDYVGGVPCETCLRTDPPDMMTDTAVLSPAMRTQLGLAPGVRFLCQCCGGFPSLTRAQRAAALGADHAAVVAEAWRDFVWERERAGAKKGLCPQNLSAPDWWAFQATCEAVPALSGIGMTGPLVAAVTARAQAWVSLGTARAGHWQQWDGAKPATPSANATGPVLLSADDQAAFEVVWAAVRP